MIEQHTALLKKALAIIVIGLLIAIISTPAQASPNTAQTACNKPAKAGQTAETITSNALARSYNLIVPPDYDGKTPIPLVVSIHGFASNPTQQAAFAGWEKIAAKEPIIIVYPSGTGFPARWYSGSTSFFGRERVNDVGFFSDLFEALSNRLCIDSARIYVNGLSNGAGMSHRLACELSERIAAIGGVAGAYSSLELACEPIRAIPVIAFHGDADPVVDYKGSAGLRFPAIQTWASEWAKRNSCRIGPTPVFKNGTVTGIGWSDCNGNADVHLYTIAGGGHTWPGGDNRTVPAFIVGSTSTAVDATSVMWAFFKTHPLPQRP